MMQLRIDFNSAIFSQCLGDMWAPCESLSQDMFSSSSSSSENFSSFLIVNIYVTLLNLYWKSVWGFSPLLARCLGCVYSSDQVLGDFPLFGNSGTFFKGMSFKPPRLPCAFQESKLLPEMKGEKNLSSPSLKRIPEIDLFLLRSWGMFVCYLYL